MKIDYTNIYEPEQDSYLLLKSLEKYLKSKLQTPQNTKLKICEIGIGSGIILSELAKKYQNQLEYYGCDINPDAIKATKQRFEQIPNTTAKLELSNLFEKFKQNKQNEKFDLIYFNTPYLPCEDNENYENLTLKDKAIYGGKKGYEIILKFLQQLNEHLNNNGTCFILYSSYSNKKIIDETLNKLQYKHKIDKEESCFFETLYSHKIQKQEILKQINQKTQENNLKLSQITYFSAGKHSKILQAKLTKNKENKTQTKKIIIKIGKAQHIEKESFFLEKLKNENFIPKTYLKEKEFIIMEKIQGKLIDNILEENTKEEIINTLQEIFKITNKLDKLNIQKFEMTNPYKHIFLTKNNKIKFIDFERSIFSEDSKNSRQFLQYIKRNIPKLKEKNIQISYEKIIELGKKLKLNNKKLIKIQEIIE